MNSYKFKKDIVRKINTILELEMFNSIFYSHLLWIAYNIICIDFRHSLAVCNDIRGNLKNLKTTHVFNIYEVQQYKNDLIKTLYINDYVKFNYNKHVSSQSNLRYPNTYNVFHIKSNHEKLNKLVSFYFIIRNFLNFQGNVVESHYDAYLFQNVLFKDKNLYHCINKYSGKMYRINSYKVDKFTTSIFDNYTMLNKNCKDSNLKNLINDKIGYAHEFLGNLIYEIKNMHFSLKYRCDYDFDVIDFCALKNELITKNKDVYSITKEALNDNIKIYSKADYADMYGNNVFVIILKNESEFERQKIVKIYL